MLRREKISESAADMKHLLHPLSVPSHHEDIELFMIHVRERNDYVNSKSSSIVHLIIQKTAAGHFRVVIYR